MTEYVYRLYKDRTLAILFLLNENTKTSLIVYIPAKIRMYLEVNLTHSVVSKKTYCYFYRHDYSLGIHQEDTTMATDEEIEARAKIIRDRDDVTMKDAKVLAQKELEMNVQPDSTSPTAQPDSTIVKEIESIIARLYQITPEDLLIFDTAYKILVAEKKDPQQAQVNEFNRKLQTLNDEYQKARQEKDAFRCLDIRDEMDKIKDEKHALELKILRDTKTTKSTKTSVPGEKKPDVPYFNGTETFLWNGQGKRGETILKWLRDAGLDPSSKDKEKMKQCADKVAEWKKAGASSPKA